MALTKQPISMPVGTVVHLSSLSKVRCGFKDDGTDRVITGAYVTLEGRLEYAVCGCTGFHPNEILIVRDVTADSLALALLLANNFENDSHKG